MPRASAAGRPFPPESLLRDAPGRGRTATVTGLGEHWSARNRLRLAEKYLRSALDIRMAIHPPDHWRIAEARTALGECLLASRRFNEAEIYLREGYEGLRASKDAPPENVRGAREKLIALYEAARQPELAARYRDR